MAKDTPSQGRPKITSGDTLNEVQPGSLNPTVDKRSGSILAQVEPSDPLSRVYSFVDSVIYNPGRLEGKNTWWGIVIRNDTRPSGPEVETTIAEVSTDASYRNNPNERGILRVWVPELHTHLPDPSAYVQWDQGPGDTDKFSEEHKLLLSIAELYPRVYGPVDYIRNIGNAILGSMVEVEFTDNFDHGKLVVPGSSVAVHKHGIPEGKHGKTTPMSAKSSPRAVSACPPCNDVPRVKTPPGKNPPADPAKDGDDSILPAEPDQPTKLEINGERHIITSDDCEWFARVIFGETFGKANRHDAQYMFWALVNRMGWGKRYWNMSIKDYFSTFSQPISKHWARTGVHCRPGGKWSRKDPCNENRLRRRDIARGLPLKDFPVRIINLVNEFMEGKIPNPDPLILDWFAGGMWKDKPYKGPGTPEKRAIKFVEGNAFIGYYNKNGTPLKTKRVRLIPGNTRLVVSGASETGNVPMA